MRSHEQPLLTYFPPEQAAEGMIYNELALDPAVMPQVPFKASRFTVDPGCATPLDHHAVHEIWIIGQGEGVLTYDGEKSTVKKGDYLYFEPPKTHTIRCSGESPLEIYSLWWSYPA